MLVLTRKTNQSIMIGDDIEISVLAVSRDKIRLGCEVLGADWDETAKRWVLDTAQGEVRARS